MRSSKACQEEINKLNSKLQSLNDLMTNAPTEAVYYQHEPGQWAPIQVAKHLLLGEQLSLKNAKYNVNRLETRKPLSIQNTVRIKILQLVLASPLKYKSPPLTRFDDDYESLTVKSLFNEWNAQRKELEDFVNEIPEEAFKKEVYKHPYANYISIGQMLLFFRAHFNHHRKQIETRLKKWERL